jgi:uncharacterized membrane protein
MTEVETGTVECQICKEKKKLSEVVPVSSLQGPMVEKIRQTHPGWSPDGFICVKDLQQFRAQYIKHILEADKGELTTLEERVVGSLKEREILSENINIEFDQKLTFGQRMADKLADYAGSWHFIGIFMGILLVWIVVNSIIIIGKFFDPYPFILLNLVLSCIAALQAPVIMMSQNRQEAKDRMRSEHDYILNLKAELEVRNINEKIDHLLTNQWQRLLEIQELQIEIMQELSGKSPHP